MLRRENRLYVSFEKLRTEPDIDSLTYVKIEADRLSSFMRTAKPCTHEVSDKGAFNNYVDRFLAFFNTPTHPS